MSHAPLTMFPPPTPYSTRDTQRLAGLGGEWPAHPARILSSTPYSLVVLGELPAGWIPAFLAGILEQECSHMTCYQDQ